MKKILEVKNLNKKYPSFELKNVSFVIEEKSIVGFIGTNGSGKSTTIKAILGLIKSSYESILFDGEAITKNPVDVKNQLGVVLDDGYFYETLKMKEMKHIVAKAYRNWDEDEYKKLMTKFGLDENQKISTLSKGMKMKFSIAIALAHHARLIIMDEPTSGLDPLVRNEFDGIIRDIVEEEGCSVLFSTHITSDLEKVADYITFIHNGKLIMTVSKNDLAYNYAVMRCKESQFLTVDPNDILAYRKRDFQIDVLVSNGKEAQRKYKGVVIDHVSVDEIMLLLVKGERV